MFNQINKPNAIFGLNIVHADAKMQKLKESTWRVLVQVFFSLLASTKGHAMVVLLFELNG